MSREFYCCIGILHKRVDFSGFIGCDAAEIVGKKCLFVGGFLGISEDVVQSA